MSNIDPRVAQVGITVNGSLTDRAIRHATFLEGLKTHEVNKVVQFMGNDVVPKLLKQTENRLAKMKKTGFTTRRLREMTVTNNALLRAGMSRASDVATSSLKNVAISEAEWQKAAIAAAMPVDVGFTLPNAAQLRSIVNSRPFEGRTLKKWFDAIGSKHGKLIDKQIRVGVAAGDSIDKIMQSLRGDGLIKDVFGGTHSIARMNRDARATVRTAVNHVSNEAKEETYKANSDIIKSVQIVATLDSRTTEICMGLDGRVYPVGEGPRPPFHYQCRTTTVPITKSYQEMGLDLPEAQAKTMRASIRGEVPAKETYGTWLQKQTGEFQDLALGKGRAKLWREGKITVRDFTKIVGDGFKTLTIEQLKQLDDISDFAAVFATMTATEKQSNIVALAKELYAPTTDTVKKKSIRAKLRKLDKDWKTKVDGKGNWIGGGAPPPELEKPKPKPKPKQARFQGDSEVIDSDVMKQVESSTGGSNPGGVYEDTDGTRWVVKSPQKGGAENVRNEVLANKLYQLAGVEVPDVRIASRNGQVAVASKYIKNLRKGSPQALIAGGARNDFVIDAWLANWDAVGTDYDNMLLNAQGKVVRIDQGGALRYRAQGELKGTAFYSDVNEIWSLRDPAKNSYAASVFKDMDDLVLADQIENRLSKINDSDIEALVEKYGPETFSERDMLLFRLKARKKNMLTQAASLRKGHADKVLAKNQAKFTAAFLEQNPATTYSIAKEINAVIDEYNAGTTSLGTATKKLEKLGYEVANGDDFIKLDLTTLPYDAVEAAKYDGTGIFGGVFRSNSAARWRQANKEWTNSLSKNEKSTILGWTVNTYSQMRKLMMGDRKASKSSTLRTMVDEFHQALSRAPVVQREMYRGISITKIDNPDVWRQFTTVGNIITQNASESWTDKQSTAVLFSKGKVVFKVKNKRGVSIKHLSGHARENEYVSLIGTKYKVTKVTPGTDITDIELSKVSAVIELEELGTVAPSRAVVKRKAPPKNVSLVEKIEQATEAKQLREILRNHKNIGQGSVSVRLSGLDFESAKEVTKAIIDIAEDSPLALKNLTEISSSADRFKGHLKQATAVFVRSDPNAPGPAQNRLIFNPHFFKTPGKAKAVLEHSHKLGHLATGTIEGMVKHELGHAVFESSTGPVKLALTLFKSELWTGVKSGAYNISAYAKTNPAEAAAEFFAYITTQPKSAWQPWHHELTQKLSNYIAHKTPTDFTIDDFGLGKYLPPPNNSPLGS